MACHFDGPVHAQSTALSLTGLPDRIMPGESYDLTVRLADREMDKAGFMIFFHQTSGPAGVAVSVSDEVDTKGAKARSTGAGTAKNESGVARWRLRWKAPESLAGPVRATLWGNAANADESPFGDRIHRRIFLARPAH